ncbi:MAG: pyridoxal phosphate-dependent aminotransferase [Myxococcota bacterium]|nr:pyridoxal phosphate-dependent aminotransferase [Myxococcota bacterium]
MTFELSRRVQAMKPSATLAMTQKANELKAQGVDVIAFGVGEPDFSTPPAICEAAKAAIDGGATHYTRVRGVDPLLNAIADDCERRRGVKPSTEEIVASVGAKHTLFNLALALFDEGDEILVPAPHWVSYPAQCRFVGATPKVLETREEDGFRLTPEALEAAVTDKTKALILCSPSNPTGSAYTGAQLRALADVAKAKGDYWIIVDEIYAELVYDGFQQESLLTLAPELRDRIIVVDGVSKTYAMTGWRIGWAIAPAHVAKAVEKIQGQSTTNPAAVSQHAAAAALNGDKAPIEEMRAAFAKRRAAIVDGLNAIDGITCRQPEGAFYAFPNVSALVGKKHAGGALEDDVALSMWLLEAARVAVVPGTAFGAPGYIRLSYATSMELIEEGLERIADAVGTLS